MSEQPTWYYTWEKLPKGPADRATLQTLVAQGFVNAQTWVWRDGWTDWQELGTTELYELLSSLPPSLSLLKPPSLPAPGSVTTLPPLVTVGLSNPKRPKRSWQLFGFNLLMLCGASTALIVSTVPLLSTVSLSLSLPVSLLAILTLALAYFRKTPKGFSVVALFAALGAVAIGLRTARTENQIKPTLTELLAIHDRGSPAPRP